MSQMGIGALPTRLSGFQDSRQKQGYVSTAITLHRSSVSGRSM